MKKAFTMIELIFVIVIIGTLAAIAIPKLANNRVDAEASICQLEVSQFSRELVKSYMMYGHNRFVNQLISNMTNIRILTQNTGAISGIVDDGYISSGVEYKCDNVKLATFTYSYDNTLKKYVLTMQVYKGTTPASLLAYNVLKRSLNISETTGKYYVF